MMTEKNKMECDDLLKTHEMTQKLLDAEAPRRQYRGRRYAGNPCPDGPRRERRDGDVYAPQSQALRH